MTERLPIGVTLRTIRAEPAGGSRARGGSTRPATQGVWAWDHFIGQGDRDRAGRRGLDDPVDGRGRVDEPRHGRAVRGQRDEPPPGGPRPHGLDAPDRERRPADPRDRDRRRSRRSTRRTASTFPEAKERAARLEEAIARHPGPLDRRPGDARRRRATRSRTPTRSRSRPRRRRSSSAARRRPGPGWPAEIGDGWARVRRQLRAEPAALPRGARGVGPAGARTSGVVVGFRGDWLGDADMLPRTRSVPSRRATSWERWREAGADGAIVLRPDDRGRRRAGRAPPIAGRRARSTAPARSSPDGRSTPTSTPPRAARASTHPCARCGAPGRRSTSGCASAATRSG